MLSQPTCFSWRALVWDKTAKNDFLREFRCSALFALTTVSRRYRLLNRALLKYSCYSPNTIFSKLEFSANSNCFCERYEHGWKAERLLCLWRSNTRTHPKKRLSCLVFAMGALLVMRSYVWSAIIVRAHYCYLPKVRKLRPRMILFLLLVAVNEDVLGLFPR